MSIKDASNWITNLKHELTKDDFVKLRELNNIPDYKDILSFVNLWLTEGIPFIFKDKPHLYEEIRYKIARGLSLDSKQISLIGSARTGFSYFREDDFKDFTIENSDLDFFIVSQLYFDSIKNEVEEDLKLEKTDESVTKLRQISRGFLCSWHFLNKYPTIKKVNATITNINKWLHTKDTAPKIRQKQNIWAGIKIYKDWHSVVQQHHVNIKYFINCK